MPVNPTPAEGVVVPQRGECVSKRRSKEYRAWAHIKGRCTNPNDAGFHNYGGRGIKMCEEWAASYEAFLREVGRAPSPEHTLDRIDNERGYEPGNVRWATKAEQSRNTRRTIIVDGLSLVDYCRANGLPYEGTQARLRRGYPLAIAISPLTGGEFRRMVRKEMER